MCAIHSTKETTTAESPSANTRVLRHSREIGKWSRTINTARLRSEKLNMRCTCCLFMLTLWSAAAGCNNRMPMCIGSFSLHSKWIGLSKRDPNSSVLRRDVESDRLIGNFVWYPGWSTTFLFCFVMVDHESLLCSEQLNWAQFFRKIHVLKILQFHLFPAVNIILRSIFSHWGHLSDSTPTIKKSFKHSLMLQKKIRCIKRRGVKTFEIWRSG